MTFDIATHADAFTALKEYLRAVGALERQVCTWRLTPERLAQAKYRCGCWIAFEHPTSPYKDLVGPFPPVSADLDEFDFAEAHLGPLVCERACKRHGGTGEIDYAVDGYGKALHELTDGRSWWTEARCVAHGGHLRVWKKERAEPGRCARCDYDGAAAPTGELDAIERALAAPEPEPLVVFRAWPEPKSDVCPGHDRVICYACDWDGGPRTEHDERLAW